MKPAAPVARTDDRCDPATGLTEGRCEVRRVAFDSVCGSPRAGSFRGVVGVRLRVDRSIARASSAGRRVSRGTMTPRPWRHGSGAAQRQEGNGRGDTVRLLTRGTLRRVSASRGGAVLGGRSDSVNLRVHRVGRSPGRTETRRTPGPVAGCNKPAGPSRRKPSRWCETTRAERDVEAWNPRPEGASASAVAPGVDAMGGTPEEGRQAGKATRGGTGRTLCSAASEVPAESRAL